MEILQFSNKNHFIIKKDKKIILQSYKSLVAEYNTETKNLIFGIDWDYSNTTLINLYKFINFFVTDFNIDKIKNKKAYLEKLIKENLIKVDNIII
jgi:hypothetical protein